MKDLKHYFTENVKGSSPRSNGETTEVTRELDDAETSANGPTKIAEPTTRRKRGRVKIKISQSANSEERVCDIVESKDDSIDKTPSPFTAGCWRDLASENSTNNETPKRSSSVPRKIVNKSATREISGDENDNSISNTDKKVFGSPSCLNDGTSRVENTSGTCADVAKVEREESNAFQVLMTRKKPVQYIVPTPMSPEDEELAARIARDSKIKIKENRERLIALADKKGYSKRKLGETEEAERIERRLEKRAKVFRVNGRKDDEEEGSPPSGRRVMPGSLHNYFR